MKKPTPVQQGCVSQILAGKDVFGLAQTGSGKTAAFALPILQKLAENPYGVYALVLTPTRELAFQISDQFKALGSGMNLRNTVVIGGMDMTAQAKALMQRPHVVIATPGRMRDHLTNDPDIAAVFARTKVVCLSVCLSVNLSAITVSFSLKPHVRRTKLSNGSGSSI
jgi:ATP-dependent RNA helicase DDX49/DBP8